MTLSPLFDKCFSCQSCDVSQIEVRARRVRLDTCDRNADTELFTSSSSLSTYDILNTMWSSWNVLLRLIHCKI